MKLESVDLLSFNEIFYFESFCSPISGAFVNRKILLSKAPEVNSEQKLFEKFREMTVSQKSKQLSFKLEISPFLSGNFFFKLHTPVAEADILHTLGPF